MKIETKSIAVFDLKDIKIIRDSVREYRSYTQEHDIFGDKSIYKQMWDLYETFDDLALSLEQRPRSEKPVLLALQSSRS